MLSDGETRISTSGRPSQRDESIASRNRWTRFLTRVHLLRVAFTFVVLWQSLALDWRVCRADEAQPAESATHAAGLKLPEGFRAELLYSVPKEEQGSWVSMTLGPDGRLIVCDQYGGLYHVTLPSTDQFEGPVEVEPIDVQVGGAQGLLWAFDSLYVVVNGAAADGPGLYRVRDTDDNGELDKVELLKALPTERIGVEHGPHGIVLGPEGESLYVIAGNMTRLPEDILLPSRHQNWDEDQLLPRGPASNGHATGLMAPGGWVCRTDAEGKKWELICAGFRNPYDLAFDRNGELFAYDADMEMDVGSPWYRPTRVCHVVSGGEFGWRYGTGKWPAYYPDSLPAVVDIGLGSPTGVAFGYGTKFPSTYQNALFICDWTYGRMFAVHLQPDGATYTGQLEEFLTGTPLPLTDIVVNPHDGALYFAIGGRRTQSGLYRVTYTSDDSHAPSESPINAAVKLRRRLEQYHGKVDPMAVDAAWPHLSSDDRHIRFAARVVIEHQSAAQWADRALSENQPDAAIQSLLALARIGDKSYQKRVIDALLRVDWDNLNSRQQADLLRVYALAFLRLDRPNTAQIEKISDELQPRFPANNRNVNHELCRVLTYLGAESVVNGGLALMAEAAQQEDRLFYGMVLSHAPNGWMTENAREFFSQLNQAETAAATGDYTGGGHLQTYIKSFREARLQYVSEETQQQLADVIRAKIEEAFPTGSPTPRKFVQHWKMEDLVPLVSQLDSGRSYKRGQEMYRAANCIQCHRFNNVGGILGPDITASAKRYSRQVMLREILKPSEVVSDQFQTHLVVTVDGRVFEGRILNEGSDSIRMATNPLNPTALVEIALDNIEVKTPSKNSMMPGDLLNTLSQVEILDLLAYIESGGDPGYSAFRSDGATESQQ